jgi:hypothetical protein
VLFQLIRMGSRAPNGIPFIVQDAFVPDFPVVLYWNREPSVAQVGNLPCRRVSAFTSFRRDRPVASSEGGAVGSALAGE